MLQDEDDIPTIDIDVAQEDKGDGVTEVTITCGCHMCCDLHLACFLVPDDEPLAASAGFEYKKLTTGFPTPFKFQSRSECQQATQWHWSSCLCWRAGGNTTTIKGSVDEEEVQVDIIDQIKAMLGKENPLVNVVV